MGQIILGDCLEVMKGIPDNSVDMVLCDLPYGTTACKWDTVIPLQPMWEQVKRLLKPKGVFVTTASQPFTSVLITSNMAWFKECLTWDKLLATGHLNAKKKHMMQHEDVVIFSPVKFGNFTYNPQMVKRDKPRVDKPTGRAFLSDGSHSYGAYKNSADAREGALEYFYPKSIITYSNANHTDIAHPTQKPVALFEYLIRTYSNEGDTILDMTAGSGTTGVAAINTGRDYILIEKDEKYYEIAKGRCGL